MSKFNEIYKSIIESHPIFKPADKKEIERRKSEKFDVWLKEQIENGDITKNSDGSYSSKGDVDLSEMNLKQFNINFKNIGEDFNCNDNNLTSLEGAPESVGGTFNCGYNNLTSLKGSPKSVESDFVCGSDNLSSLEGAPESVGGSFYCNKNILSSLKGAPKSVGGYFSCEYQKNKHEFTVEDVKAVCDVKGEIYV